MSIKAKQVAGVTTLVVVDRRGAERAIISRTLSRFLPARRPRRAAELLSQAIFQRARDVVPERPKRSLRRRCARTAASGRSSRRAATRPTSPTPRSSIPKGVAVARDSRPARARASRSRRTSSRSSKPRPFAQLRAVYSDRTFEVRQPLLAGDEEFGSIRIGVSTLLVQNELRDALEGGGTVVVAALVLSSLVAMLLSQWMLRPIHVIQSGLSRLGRGELDVRLDLPEQEFKDLGSSFEAVSAQLAAGRGLATGAEGRRCRTAGADFESVMDNLEDAVALFSPRGEVIFSNPAMRALGDRRTCPERTRSVSSSSARWRRASRPGPLSIALPRGGRPARPTRSRSGTAASVAGRRRNRSRHRAAAGLPRDRGHEPPVPRRDAGRAQRRLPEPGALDAELLAQAGGARPADGRRRARGEEPAQRDDDSPRAAEAEARARCASRSSCRRQAAGPARRSTSPSTSTSSRARSSGSTRSSTGS